jgi:hypothetical protein
LLAAPFLSSYPFTYDNWGANPAATAGTSVAPGTSNAEGAWTAIASSSNISRDVFWIAIRVHGGATAATIKSHLLDIGVDQAGGTSYTSRIDNIICGDSPASANGAPQTFLFPLFIKSGSSVAARIQGAAATAGTVTVAVKFYGDPSNPENVPVGQYSETIGTVTSSAGVSFTPGNAADGTWVSLGTTSNDLWWWQLGVQVANTTVTALRTYVDLAFGDATNKSVIMRQMIQTTTGEEVFDFMRANLVWLDAFRPVPSGATMYVRGRCSGAPDTGYSALAVGIGG